MADSLVGMAKEAQSVEDKLIKLVKSLNKYDQLELTGYVESFFNLKEVKDD